MKLKELLGMTLVASLALLATDARSEIFGDVKFIHTQNAKPTNKERIAVTHHVPYYYVEQLPGNKYSHLGRRDHVYGVENAPMPEGATTHAMSFRFRSNGYFTNNWTSHITIGLKGRWDLTHPVTGELGTLQGRGLAIGNLTGHPQPCLSPQMAVFESYWDGGNFLVPSSCSPPLAENRWYRFTIQTDIVWHLLWPQPRKETKYWIRDDQENVIHAAAFIDETNTYIPENLGGWWIGTTNTDQSIGSYSIDFADLEVWWFSQP